MINERLISSTNLRIFVFVNRHKINHKTVVIIPPGKRLKKKKVENYLNNLK